MSIFIRLLLFSIAMVFISACGNTADNQRTTNVSENKEEGTAVYSATLAIAQSLAIAFEGDVERISETEYKSKGPEIKCAAILIDKDSTFSVTSDAEWIVVPQDAGTFSEGASGVFFLPNQKGSFKIYARYPFDKEPKIESIKLTLICS